MITVIEFCVPGKPYPLKRPRRAAFGGVYDPKENVLAKREIARIAGERIVSPAVGAVGIDLVFLFARPKAHFNKAGMKGGAPIYHTQRPDVDNLIKTVLDALNGIAWGDDAQVVKISGWKRWSHQDMTTIKITSNT